MTNLPSGWESAVLAEVTTDCSQRVPGADEEFRYIDIGSVDRGAKAIVSAATLLGAEAPSRARKVVHTGDVLVSMTRPNLNAVALVPPNLDGQIASTGFDVLRAAAMDPRWIFYLVRSKSFVDSMSELVQGALYPAVRPRDVRGFRAPIAPLAEQRRIADKVDTLLARVDACRDRLDRIPEVLKRFRQAVLAAATTGALTREWRQERGVAPWTLARATDVCEKVQSGGTPKEGFITSPGIPFLKVYNIVNQKVDFDYRPQYIQPAVHRGALAKSQTKPGDVLMNIVGPPLGKVAVVPSSHGDWNINQAITLFRPSARVSTEWLYLVLCSGANVNAIVHETKGTVGQINISLTQCRDFVFPVPLRDEQAEIVAIVERLFAFADAFEEKLRSAREHVDGLVSTTLAKAFRGELVAQDPSDEPASAILTRLRAEREAGPRQKRRAKTTRA